MRSSPSSGPNGAGKTSTIDLILGLSRPTGGDVEVYGLAPAAAIARGLVSAVMQSGGLLKDLTVAETVELTASLFADSRPVAEVLERAGIAGIARRRVGKCSGGEQQRLRFAMALLSDPELLVLDEPAGARRRGRDPEPGRRGPGLAAGQPDAGRHLAKPAGAAAAGGRGLGRRLAHRPQRHGLALLWLAIAGVSLGLGLLQRQGLAPQLFNVINPGSPVGLFANRNHDAALVVAVLPLAGALFAQAFRRALGGMARASRRWRWGCLP